MEYKCNICNKIYKSYQSLWNHNNKFHNNTNLNGNTFVTHGNTNTPSELKCKYCNKIFNNRQNKWKHETKVCKNKLNLIEENSILKNEIETLKNNKIVLSNSNNLNNSNNTNNNINNGTINNNNTIIINKVGEESLNKLTYENIKDIFRQQKNCLHHAIKYVNFNENIPENHNFYNSSLEGKYVNVFNVDKKEVEKKNKKDFYDTVLISAINIMTSLYDKIRDSVSKIKQKKLLNMINELKDISYIDNTKKIYLTNINEISYNNKDVVKDTWSNKLISNEINDDELSDSDSSASSKDSFYYLTDTE
uniref:C2H2-type domain-containing protein n=1 Tax=viral metagenome TaxID=1070528 RepID=A0A6C0DAL4_9ZZZZ